MLTYNGIAGMEGLFHTETGAGIVLMGQPNEDTQLIDNPIVVNMQFFVGCKTALPQWRLILGDNPTVLFVERAQVSAHFFAYTQRDDCKLTGGDVVTLSVAG